MANNQTADDVRLQKYLSSCGVLSRRAAEEAIRRGEVKVNGRTAMIGDCVRPGEDKVEYLGREIRFEAEHPPVYVLLNKPVGVVTTLKDEQNRNTAAEYVKDYGTRLYPVGRLDRNSGGLLLFTNDGEMTYRLTHPSFHVSKTYRLNVLGDPPEETIRRFAAPMTIDGYDLKPVELLHFTRHVSVGTNETTEVVLRLHEGRNRQIRKMCEKLALKVVRLTRTSLGEISLGSLPPGKSRLLTEEEIRYLRKATRLDP
ncbi:MAG: rRNA pseudouridine synthase [Clostridia bacterium]|nr:rRNA pseudouridine synthase [Clostridia bacterium]